MELGYKIGYAISSFIVKNLVRFLKLLWTGTVTASKKNSKLLFAYACMLIAMFITFIAFNDISVTLLVIVITAIIFGIREYQEEYPIKERREYFNAVFDKIGFYEDNTNLPYYLYEKDISNYATTIAFQTLVPLNKWQNKKDIMEMYFNTKIIDIKQDTHDNRIIQLILEREPLPNHINWNDKYMDETQNKLTIGINHYGIIGMDLEQHPHGFIAGETGSGKSNILKCMIYQSLIKNYDVILIDFKRGVSFSNFSDAITIYYEYDSTMKVLGEILEETMRRLDLFRESKVDNINSYNKVTTDYLHRKIIFIDELAELLKTRDKEISNLLYDCIETLTRLSRAVGIHLIMGIQRPDSTIINGQIKNNVSFRICGRFVDKEPSRIVLGNDMASNLANIKGRFIVKDDDLQEIQSFYYSDSTPYQANKATKNVLEDNGAKISDVATIPQNEPVEEPKKVENTNVSNELNFDFSDIEKE